MDKNMIELRIDFLKLMDEYISKHGDTEIWKEWLLNSCKKEIFKAIAENTGRWNCICKLFGELTEEDDED